MYPQYICYRLRRKLHKINHGSLSPLNIYIFMIYIVIWYLYISSSVYLFCKYRKYICYLNLYRYIMRVICILICCFIHEHASIPKGIHAMTKVWSTYAYKVLHSKFIFLYDAIRRPFWCSRAYRCIILLSFAHNKYIKKKTRQ